MDRDLVSSDPVTALMEADRDGLLEYHGFVAGGYYEVGSGGRRWTLTKPEVLEQIARLRAVQRLGEIGGAARMVEIREDGTHLFQVGRRRVQLPADAVVPWYRGFVAAHAGNGQPHVGPDNIGAIQDLFADPSVSDQRSMVLLGLMYGGPREIIADQLAQMVEGRPLAKKTVLNALNFGKSMTKETADRLIAAFGLRWLADDSAEVVNADGSPAAALPQMPSLVFLRAVADASRRKMLRYGGKPNPNDARWASRFPLAVGQQLYDITVEVGPWWVQGVSAYHGIVLGRRGLT